MKTALNFEYTNDCTCEDYNEETDESTPSDYCWGSCWDYVIEDFTEITAHLFKKNQAYAWKVSDLRLWDGDVSGFVYADTALELIRGMTVNSSWIMRGTVFDDHIDYSLSHHDAPMGSSSKLTIVSKEEMEEMGLY